ncbi:hypothetical protein C0Z18_30275 [Trinickia dabaoshanensis]|uniref:Uncharacterized protein n=2 Tax=Trinickia dabaoshanensis TaxID=564714 RepID=A0A2N7VCB1_9BURK|nr:hypothetical protein C0Z18_30275 [Trinickia dabaoshanensis]
MTRIGTAALWKATAAPRRRYFNSLLMVLSTMVATVPWFRMTTFGRNLVRVAVICATHVLLTGFATAAPQSTLRFALPGGAAILYSEAANPQDPLPQRTWKRAVFYLPDGGTFGLLPRAGEPNEGGATQMEPPNDGNISPSREYIVVARDEQGAVSAGPGQPESVLDREYCSMVEIRTGCITADQTGEICGAGWRVGQRAQWGTDEQTDLMLKSDRPSARRQLGFISTGQPAELTIRDDSGADNLLRCDPPSPANREIYRKIATALDAAGAHDEARLIANSLAKAKSDLLGASAPVTVESEHGKGSATVPMLPFWGATLAGGDVSLSAKQIRPGCSVVIHKAYPAGIDPNVNATVFDRQLSWKCNGAEVVPIGTIEAEGSGPEIVTVFYRQNEIIVLARWPSDSAGADFQGDFYRVDAFRLERTNNQTTFRAVPAITHAFGDGYDGVLNGKRMAFPYKNAASIRARLAALGL